MLIRILTMTAASAATVALIAGCSSSDSEPAASPSAISPSAVAEPSPAGGGSAAPEPAQPKKSEPAATQAAAGGYIDYADYRGDEDAYSDSDVVLFFNASWCPTCQEAAANFESESFPAGLTVVSVDYDDSGDLKQKYGVTYQHTFVQVDPAGKQLAKFTGSTTVADIEGQLS